MFLLKKFENFHKEIHKILKDNYLQRPIKKLFRSDWFTPLYHIIATICSGINFYAFTASLYWSIIIEYVS